jgi:hypothetical protein
MTPRAAELERIRAASEAWLGQTCDVLRPSGAVDDAGYATGDTDEIATDVPCRVEPVADPRREGSVAGGTMAAARWLVTLAHDAPDVQARDQLVVAGVTYEAEAPSATASLAGSKVVGCIRVDG